MTAVFGTCATDGLVLGADSVYGVKSPATGEITHAVGIGRKLFKYPKFAIATYGDAPPVDAFRPKSTAL